MENVQNQHNLVVYSKVYKKDLFLAKINRIAKKAGAKLVYASFLLYYVLADPKFPVKHKAIVLGALGYLILPIDLMPDALPVVGLTDDLAALIFAIKAIFDYITPEVKKKAHDKVLSLFGEVDERELKLF